MSPHWEDSPCRSPRASVLALSAAVALTPAVAPLAAGGSRTASFPVRIAAGRAALGA